MGGIQAGVIYQQIQVFGSVLDSGLDSLLYIRLQRGGDIHVFQPQAHILTADAADGYGCGIGILQPVKIHIPEPGYIRAVLAVVIDQDYDILGGSVSHDHPDILVKTCRVFSQVQHDFRTADFKKFISSELGRVVTQNPVKTVKGNTRQGGSAVDCQYVIYIVKPR